MPRAAGIYGRGRMAARRHSAASAAAARGYIIESKAKKLFVMTPFGLFGPNPRRQPGRPAARLWPTTVTENLNISKLNSGLKCQWGMNTTMISAYAAH
jgi:hypothetical protein